MVRYSKEDFIDIALYSDRIARNGYIYFDAKELKTYADTLLRDAGVYSRMYTDVMIQHSSGNCRASTRDSIIYFLKRYERCPDRYFHNRKAQSESIDKKRVLEPLLQNGYATEFLTYYTKYKSLSSKNSSLRSLLNSVGKPSCTAGNGVELTKLAYNVKQQTNLRFNYSKYDIIAQIPKKISRSIGVEDGYFLAWGDFAQSDFRIAYNLFMRSEENDRIMSKYPDKYEALARIVADSLGRKFDKEEFLAQRTIYKKNTLAVVYGTRDSVIKEDREFIQMFASFLEKCPRYVEYYKRLEDSHSLGLPIAITSYFGYEESSPIQYRKVDTVNRALNAPVQTGTSELIIRTVNSILDRFYDLGYTEDDVSIYLVRHDEPVFRLSKRALKDVWILKDYEKILVDDWSPLEMSFQLGYWYGVPDDELMRKYEECIKANTDKIATLEQSNDFSTTYYPTKKVAKWIMYYFTVGDETVVTFYDSDNNTAHSSIVYTTEEKELVLAIRQLVTGARVNSEEYRGIVIENDLLDGEDFESGVYVRYKQSSGSQFLKVSNLCRYAVCCYCKSKGIERTVDPPAKSFEEFISSVSKMPEFA